MKIILDENIPHAFRSLLVGLEVFTVQWLGWGGIRNGELLKKADGSYDLLITVDQGIRYQNHFTDKSIRPLTILSKSNRIEDLRKFVPEILRHIDSMKPGSVMNLSVQD